MANLKIRVNESPIKCYVSLRGSSFPSGTPIIGTYEDATRSFRTDGYVDNLTKGIIFYINKTDEEIEQIIRSYELSGYIIIFIPSSQDIDRFHKIDIIEEQNRYYYPNGSHNVLKDDIKHSFFLFFNETKGIAGELFIDDRTSPKGTTIGDSQIEIGDIYDGYVFPLKLKIYPSVNTGVEYRFSGANISFSIGFLDRLGKRITFKDVMLKNIKETYYLPQRYIWRNRVLEEIYQLNASNEVLITPENFTILQNEPRSNLKDITIKTLPKNGKLLLNNNPVSISQIISKEDLYNGLLKYQSINNDNDDFSITSGYTESWYYNTIFIKK